MEGCWHWSGGWGVVVRLISRRFGEGALRKLRRLFLVLSLLSGRENWIEGLRRLGSMRKVPCQWEEPETLAASTIFQARRFFLQALQAGQDLQVG